MGACCVVGPGLLFISCSFGGGLSFLQPGRIGPDKSDYLMSPSLELPHVLCGESGVIINFWAFRSSGS